MCICSEFVKVGFFFWIYFEFCAIENTIDAKLWFLWLEMNEMNQSWNFGCDGIEFSWEWSNKIKYEKINKNVHKNEKCEANL